MYLFPATKLIKKKKPKKVLDPVRIVQKIQAHFLWRQRIVMDFKSFGKSYDDDENGSHPIYFLLLWWNFQKQRAELRNWEYI